ncbi:hypothetical protein [Bordetella sp. LUAb4]|uniref:hypothetical protein n=1 Tax=Bordetella sp. LUAb4 TaxID=2843195 RepID=UPI001E453768|nr:hypothetical protein [Bordetella sp. LUAb4]
MSMARIKERSVDAEVGDAELASLREENTMLFAQLHDVQEALERGHYLAAEQPAGAKTRFVMLDSRFPEVAAESLRYRKALEAREDVHRLQGRHSFASRFGTAMVQGVSGPGAALRLPGKLWSIWRDVKTYSPPKKLGGKSCQALIAAYGSGGDEAVQALLQRSPASVKADALTVLARSLANNDVASAASYARQAYELDPRPFRLKWLAFREHEAGRPELAEAMLEALPPEIQFSESEQRQVEQLRAEAEQARGREITQKYDPVSQSRVVEKKLRQLEHERAEQQALAARYMRQLDVVKAEQVVAERARAALAMEFAQQGTQMRGVSEERDALHRKHDELVRKYEDLVSRHEAMASEHAQAVKALAGKHEAMAGEHAQAIEARQALAKKLDDVQAAHAALARDHEALAATHEALVTTNAFSVKAHQVLINEHEDALAAHEALLRKHADVVRTHDGVVRNHHDLVKRHETAVRRSDEVGDELAALTRGHETLVRQHEIAERARAELARRHEGLVQANEALARKYEGVVRANDELTRTVSERGHELADQRREVEQLQWLRLQWERERMALLDREAASKETVESLSRSHEEGTERFTRQVELLGSMLERQHELTESYLRKLDVTDGQLERQLQTTVKNEVGNASRQLQALVGLLGYYNNGEMPLVNPERNTWPVSPDFAVYLVQLLELKHYDVVIEFGSGLSTVVIAKALARQSSPRRSKAAGKTKFVSFEHQEVYHAQTLAQLQAAGVANMVELMLAPLSPWANAKKESYPYYDYGAVLKGLAASMRGRSLSILVVVDGPPAAVGKCARYPAGPIIRQLFPRACIDFVLDDYIREDEQEIATRWQAELLASGYTCQVTERQLEKGACLISASPRSEKT